MTSHNYQLRIRDGIKLLGPTVVFVLLVAGGVHVGTALGLLPRFHPILDMDRTILAHQAEASRTHPEAEIVLIGDSSCLMNVSTRKLSEQLEIEVLNLGTLSYLDLDSFARILQEHVAHSPGNLRTVVLLVHPEFLRRHSAEPHHVHQLEASYSGHEPAVSGLKNRIRWLLGLTHFENRILPYLTAIPLPSDFRHAYGFTRDLWGFMESQHGSAIDPRRFEMRPGLGNAEYVLSRAMRKAAAGFRSVLPEGVRLVVGLTPVPVEFAGEAHTDRHRELLQELASLLEADDILASLPEVLPATDFASKTHLNAAANADYTSRLGNELAAMAGMSR